MPPSASPATATADLLGIRLAHRVMRTDLHRLTELAERLADHEPCSDKRAAAIARWIEGLCEEIHDHHTAEDVTAWPVIAQHAGTQVDLGELSADHSALDPLLDRVRAATTALVAAPENRRPAAAVALARELTVVRDDIDEHFDAEESTLFPVIERFVPAADWKRVENEVRKSGPGMRFSLPRMMGVTTPEEAARMRALAGPPLVVLHALTRPAHRRREKLVFG